MKTLHFSTPNLSLKFSLILSLSLCLSLNLNAQNWDWANKVSGNAHSRGFTICRDNNNSIFVSGSCNAPVTVGSSYLSAGDFLIKYDASGSVLWAKNVGYVAKKMCVDWIGNLYVLVDYNNSIATATNGFVTAGGWDFSLVRLDVNGNESWARSYGGKNNDYCSDMVSDPSGNVFITGWYDHPKDTLQFSNITFVDANSYGNFFLSKIDPSGNTLWVTSGLQTSSTSNFYKGLFLKIDSNHDVLVLGNGWPNGYYCWSRFSQSGALQSNQWVTNSQLYYIDCFDRDENGNLYVIYNGAGPNTSLGNLECFDSNWNHVWSFPLGGQQECYSLGNVDVDKDGNCYVYGYDVDTLYTSCLDSFQQALVLNHRVPFAGQKDAVVVKINNTGNLDWIEHAGGPGMDYPLDMCVTRDGDCYVTGGYNQYDGIRPIIFGTAIFGNHSLSSDGGVIQGFTAKIGHHTTVNINKTFGGESNLLIYPNPTTGEVFVKTDQAANLKITDLFGRCIFSDHLQAGSHALDLTDHHKGIYIVELTSDTYTKKQKIIIQ